MIKSSFTLGLIALLLPLTAAHAQTPGNKAHGTTPVLIEHATLHTVSHGIIHDGSLLIGDGRIAAIGELVTAPPDAERIDATGKHVYPGYIAANSVIGLTEISAVRATNDMSEVGPLNPNVRALQAINPDSELIGVARANGVLAALVIPRAQNHGMLAGQSALIKMDGWTAEQMRIAGPIGVHLYWPDARIPDWLPDDRAKKAKAKARKARIALEEAFLDARAYATAVAADSVDTPDLRWQAMLPVLQGKHPLFIHANHIVAIREALAFTQRHQLKNVVLVGGRDAWQLANEIARRDIPVILGSANNLPRRRDAAYDAVFASAGLLAKAGVELAIANDGSSMDASNARNLPWQAARYAAFGLARKAALRAITLGPAEILGVADRMGSLDVGKDASLFIANGPALEVTSRVERAWIQGHEISLSNRQTRLHEKYQRKYQGLPKR